MQKLGMKPVPGVSRVTIKKSKNVSETVEMDKEEDDGERGWTASRGRHAHGHWLSSVPPRTRTLDTGCDWGNTDISHAASGISSVGQWAYSARAMMCP